MRSASAINASRWTRLIFAAGLVVPVGACYRFIPLPAGPTPLAAGDEVRLTLSTNGSERLAGVLGPTTSHVTGRIVDVSDPELGLSVLATTKSTGAVLNWTGERVRVSRAFIQGTERRTLDRRRTALSVAAAFVGAVATGLIVSKVRGRAGDSGTEPPPPPPP